MGLKDKLMFWKKDDFDFSDMGPDPFNNANTGVPLTDNLNLPSDSQGSDPFGTEPSMPGSSMPGSINQRAPAPTSFSAQRDNQNASDSRRELELISSKLDTIKAILQSLDQRVGVIEQIARAEQIAQQKDKNNPTNHLW